MILWLTYWYPDKENPVRGNFIRSQWLAAKSLGLDVELLFVDIAKGKSLMDVSWIRGDDGEYILRVRSRAWKTIYHTPIWASKLISRQWINKTGLRKPSALHANVVFPAGLLSEQLARKWDIPYVITEHWSKAAKWTRHKLFGKKVRSSYEEALAILPVSDHLSLELMQCLPDISKNNFRIIPNAIDINSFKYVERKINSQKKSFQILGVASLISSNAHIKRIDLSIEALAILKRKYPDVIWSYVHAGSGDRLNFLQDYAKGLGVSENIKWLGALNSKELYEEYSKADVFLQPSKYETFGIVVLEAIQTGLCVVTSDIPAFQTWVNEQTGIRVELNSKSIAKGIENIWKNPLKVPRDVLDPKKYAPSKVGAQIKDVYRDLFSLNPAS
ncbi:MAG: Glycogen synthase [Owenweeksia sp. TMED14]|nr:MAG: Glycogen synthase [Owenweeksia sp. TMED14]|tara:strand:+ start:190 stop:1350 length:1161 start_codon:yes stop_codon:yes gene_type:complete